MPSSQSIVDCPVDSLGLPSPPQPPQVPLMRILTNSSESTSERSSPFPSVPTIVITPLLLLPYMPLWSATLATLVLSSYTLRSALLLTQYALRILPRGLGPWALWLAISQLWNLLSRNYSVLSTFAVSLPGLILSSTPSCLLPPICLTLNSPPIGCGRLSSSMIPLGSVGAKGTGIRGEAVCDTDEWRSSCTYRHLTTFGIYPGRVA